MNHFETQKTYGKQEGALGGNPVGLVIGLIIVVIMVVAVAIPVTQDVITSANLTGTEATIVNLLPVLLAVLALAFIASAFM